MSGREKAGLRGPVRTCLEENTLPGLTTYDGTRIPERKFWSTREYDVDGQVTIIRSHNSDGSESVMRHTYDASGHLLKTAGGKEGEPSQETDYSYDGQGRLLNISDSRTPDNPTTFRYDERGRKTKVQVSRAADYRPGMVVWGFLFQGPDRAPNLPGGGSATTIYDEDDRPTELQVRDAQGRLVSRAMRIYDAQGRIGEEKQILDTETMIERMFPAEIPAEKLEKILEASGTSREELRGRVTKLIGGQAGLSISIVYSYDAQGRETQRRSRSSNAEQVIETSYNEHGDKATEITRSTRIVSEKEQSEPDSGLPPYSEVHYSYQYDSYGNWTEESLSYRSSPGSAFESSTTGRRRNLTYY